MSEAADRARGPLCECVDRWPRAFGQLSMSPGRSRAEIVDVDQDGFAIERDDDVNMRGLPIVTVDSATGDVSRSAAAVGCSISLAYCGQTALTKHSACPPGI